MAISGIGNSYNLFEAAANYEQRKTFVREAISMPEEQSVNLSISEEGLSALRERVNELQPKIEYTDPREMKRVETNEIEFDYYMKMMHLSSLTLGEGGNYDVKDVMNSIMETYETLYNEIVDAHKDGDRLVSYEIMGDKILTFEEDLEKLDKAFKRNVEDIAGLVTRTQTRSITWLQHRSSIQTMQSGKEYCDMAFSMMRLARENFLALCDGKNSQEGVAKGIISDIINENAVFMEMTKELFSK